MKCIAYYFRSPEENSVHISTHNTLGLDNRPLKLKLTRALEYSVCIKILLVYLNNFPLRYTVFENELKRINFLTLSIFRSSTKCFRFYKCIVFTPAGVINWWQDVKLYRAQQQRCHAPAIRGKYPLDLCPGQLYMQKGQKGNLWTQTSKQLLSGN